MQVITGITDLLAAVQDYAVMLTVMLGLIIGLLCILIMRR